MLKTDDPTDPMGRVEHAFNLGLESEESERKLRDAMRIGLIQQQPIDQVLDKAIELDIINQEEAEKIRASHEATANAIRVDEFTKEGWKPL